MSIPFGSPVEVYAGIDLDTQIPEQSFKSIFLQIGSTLYVACATDYSPTLFFSKSTDGGATWTPCTAFTFGIETYSFAFDGSDNAYFIDQAQPAGNLAIQKYTFSTDTWSLVSDTGPIQENSRGPQNIILFSDGTFGIVCSHVVGSMPYDYVTYDGATWTVAAADIQPTVAEGTPTGVAYPYLNASGAIQYFRGYTTGPWYALIRHYASVLISKAGAFISRSVFPIPDCYGLSLGTVALGSSLAALVGGEYVAGNVTYYAVLSADGGATWTLKSAITLSDPGYLLYPLGWLTSDGTKLYWCWCYSASSTLIQIMVSSDGGATWSTQTLDVAGTGLISIGQPSFIPGVGLFFSGNDGAISSIWFVPPAAFGNEFR